jgi:hypothetical protein
MRPHVSLVLLQSDIPEVRLEMLAPDLYVASGSGGLLTGAGRLTAKFLCTRAGNDSPKRPQLSLPRRRRGLGGC